MVWGGFCGALKSYFVTVSGEAKLNSAIYVIKIMEPDLVPFWRRWCEAYGWVEVVEDEALGIRGVQFGTDT